MFPVAHHSAVPSARVDLHCHSSASYDGAVDPVRLLELARERGLTHLAITDHETLQGARAARAAQVPGITLIVGQEVRTTEGDLILLFVDQPIPGGMTPEETVRLARAQGALIGLAHPFDVQRPSIGRGAVRATDLARLASLCDYVEVFNGRVTEELANGWAADFAREHGLPAVAASDTHTETELGRCATLLEGDLNTADDLRAALRRGTAMSVRPAEAVARTEARGRLRDFLGGLRGES